ncbi:MULTISPECIES: hypothetical protein [unclassified Rhodococcus (in: high G+C Gram-positive bacteria)]|uniref:hypothetical protein n=1 Tax=unclassified Rhodococcus (in: high G+C Gram-positive bacteria) TaxID=192944 RepID=UPI001C9AA9F4|nr:MULTISPECIES: hypothetical protein [unclassified Rhodococcus (in: high G+C Gram-positive bacteria)]MBY6680668.1 hypothetical protein [Rhodococcus sp. BP-316]MBY6684050.1 hypothetical protein [Rhodococcus sp. BP-288]MBY6693289.1 hypothetical protein [Rhodococcus sp. BP-188]MBY6697486.1 hypothetical protein [Rhodococcus sp. BP-285]MBY6702163.1 hypothetical protein [Rhodococcus sp. BP-283]
MASGTSRGGTTLDEGAARAAIAALEESATAVRRSAERGVGGLFGVESAGRNHRAEAAALQDSLGRLSEGLRSWSDATAATSAALRASIDGSVSLDDVTALRVAAPGVPAQRGDR